MREVATMIDGGARLTVGIPTFNRCSWLQEAIASVLAQSFRDFRLIVSDNGSDDDTAAVVRALDDTRVEYRRNSTNIGSIANLNALIALADTEFLMLLPDDDLLYPGHLEAAIEALERFPSAGMVHTGFDLLDGRSRVLGTRTPLRPRTAAPVLEAREDALRRLMTASWPVCFSSVVYRTEAILGAGSIPDCGPFADIQLWMRMTRDWDFAYLPAALAGFRLHEQSVSRSVTDELDPQALQRRHSRMRYEQRTLFLDSAGIPTRDRAVLHSLAELEYVLESARAGISSREAWGRLLMLARTYPRVLRQRKLWRFVLARLGGSRARAVISGVRAMDRSR